ncbi:transmembrane protein 200A-like [Salmo trutta]|uniref:Transmembrane protein 200A n=1 Tax=Salmo trutta TaxID=8032 RepID=A0A674B4R4_SALTR|nr:transmembrane protein 200A-like [Salmo trutta]XP_029589704.1 transmembrane protein 200A-like [Salmo trutta]
MISAGGVITGHLAALKRQDSARSQHHLPIQSPGPGEIQEKRKARRKTRADVVVVRGKIRLYSASGLFLILGVLILMVGVAMAVLGYWPHTDPLVTANTKLSTNDTRVTQEQGGKLIQFFEQHLHSEKMKMLGPFTMGIGIFIFICANAILHENRDRETKVIHMRDMYSTVIDIHSLRIKEHKYMNGAYSGPYGEHEVRTYENQCASKLAANTLLGFPGVGNDVRVSRRTSSTENEEGLLNEAKGGHGLLPSFCRERSGSIFGLQHEGSRHEKSNFPKRCQTRSIVSSSISAFTLPVIKLNNCVIDEPDMDNITEDLEHMRVRSRPASMQSLSLAVPVPADIAKAYKPPGVMLLRSNSATESHTVSSRSSLSPGSASGSYLSPGAARKDFGSNNSLHMLSSHSKSLDLDRRPTTLTVKPEQRKHPSWPRLDRSNSKGYMKLENKEDPMDRLQLPQVAVKRDYTKKEKLLMISRSHNNLSFEHDEQFMSNTMKRGSSETRF